MKKNCLVLLLTFCAQIALGQLYSFKTFNQENGLFGEIFYKIFQDSKGFIWFGSSKGLSRYDGSRFESFSDEKYITNPIVYEIFEDKNGHIWIGTYDGLVRFDGKNWQKIYGVKNVRTILQDNQGAVYFFYVSHLMKYDYKKFEVYSHGNSLAVSTQILDNGDFLISNDKISESLVSMSLDGKKPTFTIAIDSIENYLQYENRFFNNLTKENQEKYYPLTKKTFKVPDKTIVRKIFKDKSGRIWLATEFGLMTVREDDELEKVFESQINVRVRDIEQDEQGYLYFATVNGLFIWNGIKLNTISDINGLANNNLSSCMIDKSNSLWIGLSDNNVQRLESKKFVGFTSTSKNFAGTFRPKTVLQDNYGYLNFITDKGLYRFDGERITNFNLSPFEYYIYNFIDNQNRIWIREKKGFRIVSLPKNIEQTPKTSTLDASNGLPIELQNPVDYPERHYVRKNGEVLIGSYYGVFRYNNKSWKYQKPINCTAVAAFAEDSLQRLWVGTWCGINEFKDNGIIYIKSDFVDRNNSNKTINGLAAVEVLPDKTGAIWINSFNKGLLYLKDTSNFKIFDKSDGLRSLDFEFCYLHKSGSVFVANRAGIDLMTDSIFKPFGEEFLEFKETQQIYSHGNQIWIATKSGLFKHSNGKFQKYTKAEGLLDNNPLNIFSIKDQIFILHQNGLSKYQQNFDVLPTYNGNLVVTSLSVDNVDIDISDTVYINDPSDAVKITFSLLFFINEGMNQYSYKMEGVDKDWSAFSTLNFVRYNRLEPGTHKFMLIALNSLGQKVYGEKDIVFIVKPIFYQTIWFYFLVLLVVVGLGGFIYRARVSQLKKQKLDLEIIIEQRTSEIRQKNEALLQTNQQILIQKEELEQITNELISTNNHLNQAYNEIKVKTQSILTSINYASRIQEAIMPRDSVLKRSYDYFVLFQPKDVVSGDFYWYADKDEKKIYVVADCTGHGVPGAFMTIIVNNILNHIVHEKEIHDPSDILNLIPELLGKTLSSDKNEIRDGVDLGILTIYEKDGEPYQAAFAGAITPLYYAKNNQFHEIKGDRMSIGHGYNLNKRNNYSQTIIPIDSDIIFYMSTDGFQDQFGGENFTKFLRRNFVNFLMQICKTSLSQQKEALYHAFNSWKANQSQTDDVLVMGILINYNGQLTKILESN